jgi:hypothetical protein
MKTWLICPTCKGEGRHSLALGAITEEDRLEWSSEEWDMYRRGAYDTRCETCSGTGKITDEQKAEMDDLESDPAWLREIGG